MMDYNEMYDMMRKVDRANMVKHLVAKGEDVVAKVTREAFVTLPWDIFKDAFVAFDRILTEELKAAGYTGTFREHLEDDMLF